MDLRKEYVQSDRRNQKSVYNHSSLLKNKGKMPLFSVTNYKPDRTQNPVRGNKLPKVGEDLQKAGIGCAIGLAKFGGHAFARLWK